MDEQALSSRPLHPLIPALGAAAMGAWLVAGGWLARWFGLTLVPTLALGEAGLGLVTLGLVALDRRGARSLGFRGGWRPVDLAFVPGLLALHFVGSLVMGLFLALTGRADLNSRAAAALGNLGKLPLGQALGAAFLFAILAGLCEELAFRGYLVSRLEATGVRPWVAAVLSAMAFGAIHIPGYGLAASIPKVITFGLPAGLYFAWRRSIWPLVAAHFLVDLLGFSAVIAISRLNLPGR